MLKEKLDVCIVSNRTIKKEVVDKLYESVPVASLIIDSETSPLGKAREKVISQVCTDRFLFLDDDVYLPPNYYSDLMRYWTKETGWLEGWAIPSRPEWYRNWTMSRFKHARLMRLPYNGRGFCCASIIVTKALQGWCSPPDLQYCEDLLMSNFAMQKGYEVFRAPIACEHRISYDLWTHVERGVQDNKKVRGMSNLQLIQYAGTTCLSGMKASLYTHSPAIASNSLKYATKYLEAIWRQPDPDSTVGVFSGESIKNEEVIPRSSAS
jgi:hypothetical protein